MKKFAAILLLLQAAALAAAAVPADTLRQPPDVQWRMWQGRNYYNRLAAGVYDNPAVQVSRYAFSLTEVSLNADYRHQSEPLYYEDGDGGDSFSFDAASYIRRSNFVLWGNAAYSNARLRNVRWNEISDRHLLYPYLTADSVGGDLNSECYSFAGGYAGREGRWSWGVCLSYEASIAYRGVDPRPRNVTSDLALRLGAAYDLQRYRMGIFVEGEKYKQSNDIDFYSEMGSSKVYHLTGLAMHYVRFAGNNYESYYNGYRWSGGLTLLPADGAPGWYALAGGGYFAFDKILSSLNELPMAHVDEYTARALAGYKQRIDSTASWGVSLDADYARRLGTENIFGDAANDIYPQIASAQQYTADVFTATLAGYYEGGCATRFSYGIQPRVCYATFAASYAYPSRHVNVSDLDAGADAYLSYAAGRSLWRFEAAASYVCNLSGSLFAPRGVATDDVLIPVLEHSYASLTASALHARAMLSYACRVRHNYTLGLRVGWQGGFYNTGVNGHYASASLYFVF